MKRTDRILDFTAYLLIPCYTILFVKGSNWFTTNFSVLGNVIDRKNQFVLWGLIVGIYFYVILNFISKKLQPAPKCTFLIPLALILLVFAITTPYLPQELPLKSFLHIVFAFLAAVCLALFLLLLVVRLYRENRKEYRPYLAGLLGILLFSAFLLVLAGIISSALEIFFTLGITWFCRRLSAKISRG
ncbi:MAG: hypothetical protein Q4F29_00215 [Lachnospiraceae bacterium]|nr:hypothetical protein [Lachnospiraceae bacterium]